MRLLAWQVLTDLFKVLHPRDSKMAILKYNPESRLDSLFDILLSNWALALTERYLGNILLFRLSVHFQCIQRICSRGQDEDQRSCVSRVLENKSKVKWRWHDEVVTNLIIDEVGHGWKKQIRSNASLDAHELEFVELACPWLWQLEVLRS